MFDHNLAVKHWSCHGQSGRSTLPFIKWDDLVPTRSTKVVKAYFYISYSCIPLSWVSFNVDWSEDVISVGVVRGFPLGIPPTIRVILLGGTKGDKPQPLASTK